MANNLKQYNFIKAVLLGSLFVLLSSCITEEKKEICRIQNYILYETELQDRIKLYFSSYDEKEAKELAIQQWAEEQRISLEIEHKLPKQKSIEELKIQGDLKQSYLFELENEYIKAHSDTFISQDEIQYFYDQHREEYKKESYIVKGLYLKLPDTLGKLLKVEDYYLLKNNKDFEEIENIGNLYTNSFYFEKQRWIYIDDLMREIPINSSEKEDLVKNKKHEIYTFDGETHYINILSYRVKTINAPLKEEEEKIRQHIIAQRTKELRKEAKEIILRDVEKKYPISYNN